MSRRLLLIVGGACALLLLVTGIMAVVLVSGGSDSGDSAADAAPTPVANSKGAIGLTVTFFGTAGGLRVTTVAPGGPAAEAGIHVGDVVRSFDGTVVRTPEQLRRAVEAHNAGDKVPVTYERGDKELRAEVKLGAAGDGAGVEDAPLPQSSSGPVQSRGRLGVTIIQIDPQVQERLQLRRDEGVAITNVVPGSPADKAGLHMGDIVLAVGRTNITDVAGLQRAILDVPINESVDLRIQRGAGELTITTTLPAQTNLEGLENLIPPELRERLQALLDSGTLPANQLQQLLRLYQARIENVRVGRVKSVNPGFVPPTFVVTYAPYSGGADVSTELRGNTTVRRGRDVIQPADLRPNEFIIVLSQDGGQSAFLVLAFGGN